MKHIKIMAGSQLLYDNRLPVEAGKSLLSARMQSGLNKGGAATLVLPPGHKLYDSIPPMRTCIQAYKDDRLVWRGRALPYKDDFWGIRTIPCEGELCFLNDSIMRPYELTGSPAEIFTRLLRNHNAAVDSWKRFTPGTVTVHEEDPVTIQAKTPETTMAALKRLLKVCGGFLIIGNDGSGGRRISWLRQLTQVCDQTIRLGENLLDYFNDPDIGNLATRIIPYGARRKDGTMVKIDVNGKDYVDNLEAQKVRGIIEKVVTYKDITDPEKLRQVAELDVMTSGVIPNRIQLSALDLSRFQANLDDFRVGLLVNAESEPHKLSGRYAIITVEEDLAKPDTGKISLTRDALLTDKTTLTGSISGEMEEQGNEIIAGMAQEIEAATAWLTNGLGHMMVRKDPQTGTPIDLLFLDTPDMNTAVEVLRIGQSGIGFSHKGIEGPYESAWTLDGKFNAKFIATGVLTANLIRAGILKDNGGNFILNLKTGECDIQKGNISLGPNDELRLTDSGEIHAVRGTIGPLTISDTEVYTASVKISEERLRIKDLSSDRICDFEVVPDHWVWVEDPGGGGEIIPDPEGPGGGGEIIPEPEDPVVRSVRSAGAPPARQGKSGHWEASSERKFAIVPSQDCFLGLAQSAYGDSMMTFDPSTNTITVNSKLMFDYNYGEFCSRWGNSGETVELTFANGETLVFEDGLLVSSYGFISQ